MSERAKEEKRVNGVIERQGKGTKKVRWNGWLTEENYDYICREALRDERSMASVLNKMLRDLRQNSVLRG